MSKNALNLGLFFRFSRNVLTSATNLSTLVVKNICSDAMLKLIGTHCTSLQYLDISNSKQVSDMGIESLCFQVQIRDKRESLVAGGIDSANGGGSSSSDATAGVIQIVEEATPLTITVTSASATGTASPTPAAAVNSCNVSNNFAATYHRKVDHSSMPARMREEDFGPDANAGDSAVGCGGHLPSWRDLRQRVRKCLTSNTSSQELQQECLVEFKQVFHPLCSTLKIFDITDTSVTNAGLIIILQKLTKLNSLGEYSISDNFLKSLFVVPYLNIDKFGLLSVHTRKVT